MTLIDFFRDIANYFISKYELVNAQFWIGVTDNSNEGTWVWLNGDLASDDEIRWNAGNPIQPGADRADEDCTVIGESIGWRAADVTCGSRRSVLCELKLAEGQCSS